jgi:hypothetical protein
MAMFHPIHLLIGVGRPGEALEVERPVRPGEGEKEADALEVSSALIRPFMFRPILRNLQTIYFFRNVTRETRALSCGEIHTALRHSATWR